MNILLKKIGARFLLVLLAVSILFSGFNILGSNNSRVYASTSTSNTAYIFSVNCKNLASSIENQYTNYLLNGGALPSANVNINIVSGGTGSLTIPVSTYSGSGGTSLTTPLSLLSPSCNNLNISTTGLITSIKYNYNKAGVFGGQPSATLYYYTNSNEKLYNANFACGGNTSCLSCLTQKGNQNYQYVYTDFGCVNTSLYGVINFVYNLVLTLAFMLAFAVIIFAGYLIMVSGGDPEKLGRGKSLMTKAIIGLLVIIFAFILLTSIGAIFHIQFLQFL